MPTYNLAKVLEPVYAIFDESVVNGLIQGAAHKAGIEGVRIVLNHYPPEPPGSDAPSPLRTAKQWRWWWANMRALADPKKRHTVPDSLRGWKARYVKVGKRKVLKLSGHYKRTGTLVRSISYDVSRDDGGGTTIAIGPTMARGIHHISSRKPGAYAKYVIGKEDQAPIHKGRWEPLVDIVDQNSKQIMQAFLQSFAQLVSQQLKVNIMRNTE